MARKRGSMVSVEWKGERELKMALRQAPKKFNAVARTAITKAIRPIAKDMKKAIAKFAWPEDTAGLIQIAKRNIKTGPKKGSKERKAKFKHFPFKVVGMATGDKVSTGRGRGSFLANWLWNHEFGTEDGAIGRKHPPNRQFLRVYGKAKGTTSRILIRAMRQGISTTKWKTTAHK